MAILNHANYIPSLKGDDRTSQSWTTTGNTHTVTNGHVAANSHISIMWTSSGAPDSWYVTASAGSFIVTASTVVASGTTFNYLIL